MKRKISRRKFLSASTQVALSASFPITINSSLSFGNSIYCPILMYHYVDLLPEDADRYRRDLTVAPELFEQHVNFIQENDFTSITLAELVAGFTTPDSLPEKPIILTFDDGYAGAFSQVLPQLLARNMVGTFFIVSDYIGIPGYLTQEQIFVMCEGGMEIGSHSQSHPDMTRLNYEEVVRELNNAAQILGTIIGKSSEVFCYPLGRYNSTIIRALKATGHLAATTTADGTLHNPSYPYHLRRIRIRGNTSVKSLDWLLNRRV